MNLTDRLKGAIARLERANRWYTIVEIHHEGGHVDDPARSADWSVATEAQLEEEFEHGYATGYNAACAEADALLREKTAARETGEEWVARVAPSWLSEGRS